MSKKRKNNRILKIHIKKGKPTPNFSHRPKFEEY